MRVDEVLDGAADDLDFGHGWTQGMMNDTKGRHCVDGAIACLAGGMVIVHLDTNVTSTERSYLHTEALNYFLNFVGGSWAGNIWMWNDRPERSREQVVDTLRNAAKSWREEHPDATA